MDLLVKSLWGQMDHLSSEEKQSIIEELQLLQQNEFKSEPVNTGELSPAAVLPEESEETSEENGGNSVNLLQDLVLVNDVTTSNAQDGIIFVVFVYSYGLYFYLTRKK
jgi:hypothetical protein